MIQNNPTERVKIGAILRSADKAGLFRVSRFTPIAKIQTFSPKSRRVSA